MARASAFLVVPSFPLKSLCLVATLLVTFDVAEAQLGRGRRFGGGRSAGGAARPDGSRLSEEQKQNLLQLKNDLSAIKSGSQVTDEQKAALRDSLLAIADEATPPDPALARALADDLAEALADGELSGADRVQLTISLAAVMNSASVSPEKVAAALENAQAILAASGVDRDDVETIADDLRAIVATAASERPNAPPAPAAGR